MSKANRYNGNTGISFIVSRSLMAVVVACILVLPAVRLAAGRLPGNQWRLLAIEYPPGLKVEVALGGGEKTLMTKGTCKVKGERQSASFEIEIKDLPPVGTIGWSGRQYVLWAIGKHKKMLNLGVVPLKGKDAKLSGQVPFRAFGFLVTAEKNPKAKSPSAAVAVESLLPTNPDLVVPVLRIKVPLTPQKG